MKQYTDAIQTMRLKDLGFPSPKSVSKLSLDWDMDTVPTFDYSIGELIEMLPKSIKVNECFFTLAISAGSDNWLVEYNDIAFGSQAGVCKSELIDALFSEIEILKEEGVI